MAVDFDQLIKDGDLDSCRSLLFEEVKKNPLDPKLRVFLFQLLCVLGDWERASNQLEVAAELDPQCLMLKAMYGPAIQAEPFRSDVFHGLRAPLIFGEPEEWMSWLLEANRLEGQGETKAAADLRDKAFEAAPASPGRVNDEAFEWIADADVHYGPLVEAIVNGKHYWIPFQRIRKAVLEPPTDLRDMVWATAQFVWMNGGEAFGLIPVRYPGSETHEEAAVRLSRATHWTDLEGGLHRGIGQRLLATDGGDHALLEIRELVFEGGEDGSPAEGDGSGAKEA
jgi:type VI secretion system protein ImpE